MAQLDDINNAELLPARPARSASNCAGSSAGPSSSSASMAQHLQNILGSNQAIIAQIARSGEAIVQEDEADKRLHNYAKILAVLYPAFLLFVIAIFITAVILRDPLWVGLNRICDIVLAIGCFSVSLLYQDLICSYARRRVFADDRYIVDSALAWFRVSTCLGLVCTLASIVLSAMSLKSGSDMITIRDWIAFVAVMGDIVLTLSAATIYHIRPASPSSRPQRSRSNHSEWFLPMRLLMEALH